MRGDVMKRLVSITLVAFSLLAICAIGADAADKKFSLVVREGFGSIAIGDLNNVLSSVNSDAVYTSLRESGSGLCVGEIREVPNHFKDWEVELRWMPKYFGIGLAFASPTKYYSKSHLDYTIGYSGVMETVGFTYESKISAYTPIKLSFCFSPPPISGARLVLNAGAGYYRAKMFYGTLDQYYYSSSKYLLSYNDYVEGKQIGFHCGIGFEYKLSARFSILAEGQWRLAKITTLTGYGDVWEKYYDADGNLLIDNSATTESTRILYHYIGTDSATGTRHEKMIMIASSAEPPFVTLDDGSDFRKATLDLSGFTFKIGLKIGVF